MRKIIIVTAVIVYGLFAVGVAADLSRPAVNRIVETTAETETQTVVTEGKKAVYVVKELDGIIAVSDRASGKIITRTETRVALLPRSDRRRLEKGIEVEDKSELRTLLEDICS